MRGRNAVLSQGASEGRWPPPKNNVFVFAAVTQGRARVAGSSPAAPARARVLAHLAAAQQSSAAFQTLRARVMLLQNQGWDPAVNQSPAPGWRNSSARRSSPSGRALWGLCRAPGALLTLLSTSRSCCRGSWPPFRRCCQRCPTVLRPLHVALRATAVGRGAKLPS